MQQKTWKLIVGRLVLGVVLAAALELTGLAQKYEAGAEFTTFVPQGEFKDNISNNGYGGGGNFLFGLWRSPFLAGIDVGFVNYGSVGRSVPLAPTIPEVRVDVFTDNNIVLTHFLLRAKPRHGTVQPYGDVLIGLKYLYTSTTVRGDSENDPIASDTNLSDTALSYGVGGGLQVSVAKFSGAELMIDGGARYLWGSHANYLRKGSITEINGVPVFDVLSSRTDALTLRIGVTFRF